jgi:predicted negative regulator of RcsB-dependent stress response
MEFILIIAVVVIAVLAYRSYRRTQLQTKQQHEITAAELESVKRTADEDITRFGEELQDLDLEMVGKDLGDAAAAVRRPHGRAHRQRRTGRPRGSRSRA